MRGDLVYELIGGIREEFVREAEPRSLSALTEMATPTASDALLYSISEKSRSRKKKRWIPWLVAAAVVLTVGLNLSIFAGVTAILGQSGNLPGGSTAPSGSFFGSLFPFWNPEPEPPYQAPVRDPEEITEETEIPTEDSTEEPTEEVTEPEIETEHPCADGHYEEILLDRAPSCYAVSRFHTVCRVCGYEQDFYGEEKLPHTFRSGYCADCGLIEGAYPSEQCFFSLYNSDGYRLDNLLGDIGETLILPNVHFTEENGLLPVTVIGDHLLSGRCEFGTLVLPDSVHTIENTGAFFGCRSLETVVWPSNLMYIGSNAFANCVSLTEITLPDTVTEVGGWLFNGCIALEKVVLPDNLTHIGQSTFQGCSALTEVTLPAELTEIPTCMFALCTALKTVELPEKLKVIDAMAFQDCSSMASIDLPDSVEGIRSAAFWGCTALEQIRLPKNLLQLMSQVFFGCELITELSLPSKLKYLESRAFSDMNIREIALPASLIQVDKEAFMGCATLESVTYAGTVQEWRELFTGSLAIPVHCMDGTVPSEFDSTE